MIRYLDFNDDISKESGPHPSDMIASIMAISEALHADGKNLALGITIAYGIMGHIADRAKRRSTKWDYGYQHAVGASMRAGKVLHQIRWLMKGVKATCLEFHLMR